MSSAPVSKARFNDGVATNLDRSPRPVPGLPDFRPQHLRDEEIAASSTQRLAMRT